MLTLVTTTLTASFFDSLNPSAIAQQMLLQAVVKKKRHVWFFIIGIALANFTMGIAVYYGVAKHLSRLWQDTMLRYPVQLRIAELALAVLCIVLSVRMFLKVRKGAEQEQAKSVNNLKPLSLFALGATFCLVELTSALPYFGFLAVLTTYSLSVPLVLLFIFVYTFIYSLPLILLYFGYNKLRGTSFIKRTEKVLAKVSAYIMPVAVSLLAVVFIVNAVKL